MQPLSFFWQEKQAKNRVRSRFNLLLLEYGEYFLQDYSAYSFPLPRYDRWVVCLLFACFCCAVIGAVVVVVDWAQ